MSAYSHAEGLNRNAGSNCAAPTLNEATCQAVAQERRYDSRFSPTSRDFT